MYLSNYYEQITATAALPRTAPGIGSTSASGTNSDIYTAECSAQPSEVLSGDTQLGRLLKTNFGQLCGLMAYMMRSILYEFSDVLFSDCEKM